MSKLTKILTLLLILFSSAMSAVLFEVKSSSGKKVMEVCDDGVRFYNPDTDPEELLSEISASNIEFKTNSDKLRDFAVSDIGNSSKGSTGKLLKLSNQASMSGMGDSMIVFYKPKNAFRTNSILQDVNLVGDGSFASGYLCEASGVYSTAMGYRSKASGSSSVAVGNNVKATGPSTLAAGYGTIATGEQATAMGQQTSAIGASSTAMGAFATANGFYSTAIGSNLQADALNSFVIGRYNKRPVCDPHSWVPTDPLFIVGNGSSSYYTNAFEVYKNGDVHIPSLYSTHITSRKFVTVDNFGKLCVTESASNPTSTAFGYNTIASGQYSTAMGTTTTASGTGSTATGHETIANGDYSSAMNQRTIASGNISTAIGYKTTAQSFASLVMGQYNKIEGNSSGWYSSDPLFVIGNGSSSAPSNAFEVKKNGDTYIPSLYTTTSANAKKTVLVDNQGKLCVMSAKDDSAELNDLKKENSDLKARVAKLESLMEQMLKK